MELTNFFVYQYNFYVIVKVLVVIGNLTEGLTVFELKDGNVMRRVGIGVSHRSLAAPDAASSINSLYIGLLIRESRYSSWFLRRKTATRGTDGEREQVSKGPDEAKPGWPVHTAVPGRDCMHDR